MLTEILVEALSNMDYDTLEHVLESCSEEELAFVDEAMEMSKADFKAENVNTFKRNDHLKSFRLDNGTGMTARTFANLKGDASRHFGMYTLDNPRHVQELRIVTGNIEQQLDKLGSEAGLSQDVIDKIRLRARREYMRSAGDSSRATINRDYDNKVSANFDDVLAAQNDPETYNKMVKSYVEWAKRENAKLHAKRAAGDVKEKLLQKLNKLKPSDLKNT